MTQSILCVSRVCIVVCALGIVACQPELLKKPETGPAASPNASSSASSSDSVTAESHADCVAPNQTGCVASTAFHTQSVPASPAAASQVISGKQFYVGGAVQTGTMIDRGNWDMDAAAWPGEGRYSGFTTTIASLNVCTDAQIFGVAGTAVCIADTTGTVAAATEVLGGRVAWDNTGSKITGEMNDRGALNASASFPGDGYYHGAVTNAPTASQVVSGATILGVAGSASYGDFSASLQHRDSATAQVTLKTEAVTNAATVYTNADPGYRAVPKISKDDDGALGGSVTYVDRTTNNWTNKCDAATGQAGGSANSACKCGLSGTIAQRIANCAAHGVIGANSTWDGEAKGNAGQGKWKLVTRTGNVTSSKGREVWQDQRTMLLWSSAVSTSLNWCKATGSNNIPGNPAAEADPAGICTNPATQNTVGQAKSACFEDDGMYFTQIDAAIDSAGKGGLGRTSTPAVGWRLPTKYDYQAADNNGIRFVVPDIANLEWSATVFTNGRSNAFLMTNYGTFINNYLRSNAQTVRCVGR